ncbi:putative Transcriptional regulator, GntR family [Sulfitobacter noctilucicola]|uniref:DNA-binding GntR family transcriptional regulator n=1 Tax=Sulfitobacter noctilucicola TaxID=1342301 RepID=A0A7W6Q5M3_9RHOB|nr:GntR family transcriptional regulator [Sulfitobacter noctilucicola]KIN64095.1 putative Transcriptional regulator, GntR family [Sulfitobacter noctilucicola]MBB4175449.1 DNA-binding GntR family transcriptional regulator [Sulfitobacter noctilucicola]
MSSTERTRKTPRYLEVFKLIRADIDTGKVKVGDLLPSEASLCARFDVSRFTVREALRRLQADGMVSRTQGAGSRVLRTTPSGVYVQNYRSVSELSQYAAETTLDLLKSEDTILDADMAVRLGRTEGEEWALLTGLRRTSEGTALALVESYVPARFKDIAAELAQGEGAIHIGLAEAAGTAISHAEQETQALPAPYHVADALDLPEHTPVLRILRHYISGEGLLIASFNWHRGGDSYIHRTRITLEAE